MAADLTIKEQPKKSVGVKPRYRFDWLLRDAERQLSTQRSLSIIAICTIILTIVILGSAFHSAKPIMLPLTTALIISILLAPVSDWLKRWGLPESLRAGLLVLATLLGLGAAFYYLGKPAVSFLEGLPTVAQEARQKLNGVEKAVTQVQEVSKQVGEITDMAPAADKPEEVIVRQRSFSDALTQSARNIVVQILFTAVLVYFLLATRTSFRMKAIAARNTLSGRLQSARILRDVQKKVGAYMFTMVLINIGLGAATAVAMMLIGMPSPLVWGLLAGVLNFIPYIGPVVMTMLLALSGVVQYDTLQGAAMPALIYVAFNFIESNFITPSLVAVRLLISPLAIVVAVALLTWMWGPVGAVIAIPLVVILKTVCDSIDALKPIGVFIGDLKVVKGRKLGFCRIHPETAPRAN